MHAARWPRRLTRGVNVSSSAPAIRVRRATGGSGAPPSTSPPRPPAAARADAGRWRLQFRQKLQVVPRETLETWLGQDAHAQSSTNAAPRQSPPVGHVARAGSSSVPYTQLIAVGRPACVRFSEDLLEEARRGVGLT